MPAPVAAADKRVRGNRLLRAVYINDFQFDSDNLTCKGEKGTATYDPGFKTLTLDNLTVSTHYANGIIWNGGISGLTIRITALNEVVKKDSSRALNGWVLDPTQNGGYPDFGAGSGLKTARRASCSTVRSSPLAAR